MHMMAFAEGNGNDLFLINKNLDVFIVFITISLNLMTATMVRELVISSVIIHDDINFEFMIYYLNILNRKI